MLIIILHILLNSDSSYRVVKWFHDKNNPKWKSSFTYSNEPHLLPVYFGIETGKIIASMQYLHILQLPLYLWIIK